MWKNLSKIWKIRPYSRAIQDCMSKRWWRTTLYWHYLERANNIREIRKKEEELNFDVTNCNKFNEKNTDLIHIYNAADEPLGENENLWTYIQRKCILLSKSAFFWFFIWGNNWSRRWKCKQHVNGYKFCVSFFFFS